MTISEKDRLSLEELRRIATDNGGKLLSKEWLGVKEKHRFVFADGRQFEMQPNNLTRNGWPKNPDIYFNRTGPVQTSILDYNERMLSPLRAIAEANGGALLSKEWLGANAPLRFAFADEREFEMQPAHLKTSGWPQNAESYIRRSSDRASIQLADLEKMAEANGGRLISEEWLGALSSHRFAFADGREFQMRPGNLKAQGWPKNPDRYFALAKNPEYYLQQLRNLAQAKGGKLLSEEWLGNEAEHRFAFADGREFEIQPRTLKARGWPTDPNQFFKMRESIIASCATADRSGSAQSLGEHEEDRSAVAGAKARPRRTG